jgi:hypothetical protein
MNQETIIFAKKMLTVFECGWTVESTSLLTNFLFLIGALEDGSFRVEDAKKRAKCTTAKVMIPATGRNNELLSNLSRLGSIFPGLDSLVKDD